MKNYDVVIVEAATTGSFFARRMAERGRSVLVIDRLAEEKVGAKYDNAQIHHAFEPKRAVESGHPAG